ncbi:MAG TPA: phosphoenolpyruvate-utilizing N-terminal domain-containing protein, partial [Tepidisphaeraceae bacterium]|nr:phosphoenolpyruvate-utilizing N-terminal domain-containing protein [Tepidisphaeraceae bacterium]
MEIKKGIGVSPGVVISTAVVLDAEDLRVPKRTVEPGQVQSELDRLGEAIGAAVVELNTLRDQVATRHGKEIAAIFDVHMGMLKDKYVFQQIIQAIKDQQTTAEYAVSVVMRRQAAVFAKMKDAYLAERVKDIHDIEKRILHHLIGRKRQDLAKLTSDVVVIAHDLLPSQTAALDKSHVRGFACDVGGRDAVLKRRNELR